MRKVGGSFGLGFDSVLLTSCGGCKGNIEDLWEDVPHLIKRVMVTCDLRTGIAYPMRDLPSITHFCKGYCVGTMFASAAILGFQKAVEVVWVIGHSNGLR